MYQLNITRQKNFQLYLISFKTLHIACVSVPATTWRKLDDSVRLLVCNVRNRRSHNILRKIALKMPLNCTQIAFSRTKRLILLQSIGAK